MHIDVITGNGCLIRFNKDEQNSYFMVSPYSLGLFSLELISFGGSAFILFRTYRKTKYPSHIILAISFCSFILNSVMRLSTSFFSENIILYEDSVGGVSIGHINILWSTMNVALILAIYLTFFAFFYVKMNRFHPMLNFVSLLMGGLIFAFIYPPFTELSFDPTINAWTGKYDIWVLVLIIPILIFFIIAVILPVATKIVKSSDKRIRAQMAIQVLGLGIVILWSFFAAFTSFRIVAVIRPFCLPLGWLIWSLTVLMDPFNIMVSNAKISQIYIATEAGLPFYYTDFEGSQEISADLATSMISGVTEALEVLVQRKDKLSVLNYENRVLGIVSVDFLTAYVFGERFDRTLETVLTFLLQSLLKNTDLIQQIKPGYVNLDAETKQSVAKIVNEALKSVLVI